MGLAVLVAGIGPAFAEGGGGFAPQDHWTSRVEAAIETGAHPQPGTGKQAAETEVRARPQAGGDPAAFASDPRWKESGGE